MGVRRKREDEENRKIMVNGRRKRENEDNRKITIREESKYEGNGGN